MQILVLFGASLLLIGLGSSRVLTYHEVVFAEPAKEMLASGDFVVPRIGGVPFTDKPPATAWTIAAAMTLFRSQSEWVVRLPSVPWRPSSRRWSLPHLRPAGSAGRMAWLPG